MIDDIYLMFMSATKEGKILLKELWGKTFPEGDFVTQWLKDSKAIKKPIDSDRQYYKMVALALLYGLGPKKLQKQSYEAFNREISFQEAQEIYRAYWHTFSGVKKLADSSKQKVKEVGLLMRLDIGWCLTLAASLTPRIKPVTTLFKVRFQVFYICLSTI